MRIESTIGVRRRRRQRGKAAACGLLTGCVVTLIGMTVGLEPHVILWRALLSGALMGVLVSFGMGVVQMANSNS
ncbi:MAG TPA: hypothetical protein PKD54_04875 [Pirellulaceae bacterium]|nr:hypothetical protein [Pirellulaceae bacterium]